MDLKDRAEFLSPLHLSGNIRTPASSSLLEEGYDFKTVQELLDESDADTTMVYTQVLDRGENAVRSTADFAIVTAGESGTFNSSMDNTMLVSIFN